MTPTGTPSLIRGRSYPGRSAPRCLDSCERIKPRHDRIPKENPNYDPCAYRGSLRMHHHVDDERPDTLVEQQVTAMSGRKTHADLLRNAGLSHASSAANVVMVATKHTTMFHATSRPMARDGRNSEVAMARKPATTTTAL